MVKSEPELLQKYVKVKFTPVAHQNNHVLGQTVYFHQQSSTFEIIFKFDAKF